MSYFKDKSKTTKTASDLDAVFSIFLDINDSKDHITMSDNIILAIKEHYKISEFTEEYMPIFEQINDRIFKDPIVPNLITEEKSQPKNEDRPNKFKHKYRL